MASRGQKWKIKAAARALTHLKEQARQMRFDLRQAVFADARLAVVADGNQCGHHVKVQIKQPQAGAVAAAVFAPLRGLDVKMFDAAAAELLDDIGQLIGMEFAHQIGRGQLLEFTVAVLQIDSGRMIDMQEGQRVGVHDENLMFGMLRQIGKPGFFEHGRAHPY